MKFIIYLPTLIASIFVSMLLSAQNNECKTVNDIDGNKYNAVLIGDQCWMKENLKVTHYPNGDAIPYIIEDSEWAALEDNNTDDAYCFFEDNTNCIFGALYSYAAAIANNWQSNNKSGQGICPDGWHLPTDFEWTTLIDFLGGKSIAGGKLKESGTSHWSSLRFVNTVATNITGFTALPGGSRYSWDGRYGAFNVYYLGVWWSATENDFNGAWIRSLESESAEAKRTTFPKSVGLSVRCIKDLKTNSETRDTMDVNDKGKWKKRKSDTTFFRMKRVDNKKTIIKK